MRPGRQLAGELLDAVRARAQALTVFAERLQGRLVNHVLAVETCVFDPDATPVARQWHAAAGCVQVDNLSDTNTITVVAGGPGANPPPTSGIGVYRVPPGTTRVIGIASRQVTFYGTAGDVLCYQAFTSVPRPTVGGQTTAGDAPPPPAGPPDLIGAVTNAGDGINVPFLDMVLPLACSTGDTCTLIMGSSGGLDQPAGWAPATILAALTPTASAGRITVIGGPLQAADVAAGFVRVPTTGGANLRLAGAGEVCGPGVLDQLVTDAINTTGTTTTAPSCTPTTQVRLIRGVGVMVNVTTAGPCTWAMPDLIAQDSCPSLTLRNPTVAVSDAPFAGDGVTPTGTAVGSSFDTAPAPLIVQRQAVTLAWRRP